MAVAVDGSSPARFAAVATMGSSGTYPVSASFTAPTDALLVCTVQMDTQAAANPVIAVSDSGGLTWTNRVERQDQETTIGGYSSVATARTTSSVSRTVTVGWTSGSGADTTRRISAKVYVLTGVDVNGTPLDTVGANNEGGSGTNNLTTSSITPGANGMLIASDCEWNTLGAFEASSDLTQDTTTYAGEISVCSGFKTSTSGVGVTANLNAAGTGTPQHKWCQITAREAATAGDTGEWMGRLAPMKAPRIVQVMY